MNNKLTASIRFNFKGQTHEPELEFELDEVMQTVGCIPDLYPLIARANNYDMYSYEYEMMQAENIIFSNASGLVADFITEQKLDFAAFEQAWHTKQALKNIALIAKEKMNVDDLSQQPELEAALLEAYNLGRLK